MSQREELLEALANQSALIPPPEVHSRRCKDCREEWRLPVGMQCCPPCSEKRLRRALLERRRENRHTTLAGANVPPRFHSPAEDFTWPRDPDTDQDLSTWRGTPWIVTILGVPGAGKSRLAVEMAFAWLCADADLQDVVWMRGFSLAGAVLNGRPQADRARSCRLLVIEDFGMGLIRRKDWAQLGEVLAERQDLQRATVVTTNRNDSDLRAFHPPTANRLLDGVVCRLPIP